MVKAGQPVGAQLVDRHRLTRDESPCRSFGVDTSQLVPRGLLGGVVAAHLAAFPVGILPGIDGDPVPDDGLTLNAPIR